MSERVRNLLTVGVIVVMAAVLVTLVATAPTDTDRVADIGSRIKCPVCQGESIGNSPSQMARDMMSLVAERVESGLSDEAIIDELLGSFSGAVLLDPPASGATLLLWIAPLVVLVFGVAVIWWWRSHPREETPAEQDPPRPRRLAPILLLGGAFAAIVVMAGFFIQDRAGPASGVADVAGQDLSQVSNETMEAVIEANADNPQVDGMRLALAERYYEEGDYQSAFPHYLAVAESSQATNPQVVAALVRLGWMAWLSNAEVSAAVGLFDQALAIEPSASTAKYFKGMVLWCGTDQLGEAESLFEEVLADPDLTADSRPRVEADLASLRAGESCGA